MISEMFWNRLFKPFDYTLHAALISDIGKKRVENQDNFCFDTFINVNKAKSVRLKSQNFALPEAYAIMDGMGGEKLGAQASLEAAGFFSSVYKEILSDLNTADNKRKERIFEDLVYTLNERIRKMAREQGVRRSGTTLAAIFFMEKKAYVLSVGDSEVFLIREGQIYRLNKLDSMTITVDDENGGQRKIKGGLSQFLGMDTEEYGFHLNIKELELENKDSFLICSDGLTDYVGNAEIAEIVCEYELMDSIKTLLGLAMERGGKDNTTILRVDVS